MRIPLVADNRGEHGRAEEDLRRSEQRYRSLVEATSQIVWTATTEGLVETDLPTWRAYTGQTEDEIQGTGWLDALHPDDRKRTATVWENVVATRSVYDIEYRLRGKDGNYRHFAARGVPVLEEDGNIRERIGTCTDITKRKEAEEELRRSEAILAAAQRIAHLGSWEWDIIRDEERWSDEVYRLFGYQPGEHRPNYEAFLNAVHPEDREQVKLAVQAALRDRAPYSLDHRVLLPDGEVRHVHEEGEVVFEGGKPVRMVGTVHDITDRRLAEEQVRQALRLRNEFLSVASHELKTPVTLLKGYSQILTSKARQKGDQEMVKPLEIIDRQVNRMAQLIEDLLDISRIESGKMPFDMAPLDLGAVTEEVIGEVRASYPDFELRTHIPTASVWVRGDKLRLQQVITNLLLNAVKYSGGFREVDLRLCREDGQAVVSVSDRGIGIPVEQQPQVFELYFRGANAPTNNYGGLGLGLYISRGIVERHGGAMRLVSEVGKGSTFSFTLPLLDSESLPAVNDSAEGSGGE